LFRSQSIRVDPKGRRLGVEETDALSEISSDAHHLESNPGE
jgi:hypothetical protein